VDSLGVPILRENLDELQQTVQLMQAENADEFYDISTRNKKYGRVDAMQGPLLLEKYGPQNSHCLLGPITNFLLHQAYPDSPSPIQGGQVCHHIFPVRKEDVMNLQVIVSHRLLW
jgi:hypothetical protein